MCIYLFMETAACSYSAIMGLLGAVFSFKHIEKTVIRSHKHLDLDP